MLIYLREEKIDTSSALKPAPPQRKKKRSEVGFAFINFSKYSIEVSQSLYLKASLAMESNEFSLLFLFIDSFNSFI